MFIDSFLPTGKVYFAVILASVFMFIKLNKKLKVLAIIPLIIIAQDRGLYIDNPNLKISMPQLNVKQDQKWMKSNLSNVIEKNLILVDKAIEKRKELVILPETAFPINLNRNDFLLEKLVEKSTHIDIITGALLYENKQFYNATYYFSKGVIKVAKKSCFSSFWRENSITWNFCWLYKWHLL